MNAKFKLFVGIFSSALVGIALFGMVAYETAIMTSYDRETDLLKRFATYYASDLIYDAEKEGGTINAQFISKWLDRVEEPFGVFAFTREQDNLTIVDSRMLSRYNVIKLVDNKMMGSKSLDNFTHIWYSTNIPNSKFYIGVIHRVSHNESKSYFQSLGVPLIVTASILLWLTTWATIYITTLYEKLARQTKEMEFQATHDPLTKLSNRQKFIKDTNILIESSADKKNVAMAFINLNNFKHVNQTLGHNYGDQLLKTVAGRIVEVCNSTDVVARIGADVFSVIMHDYNPEEAINMSEKILTNIEKSMTVNNIKLKMSVSIGVAIYPLHAGSFDELSQRSEIAMCAAKKMGSRITVFHDDLLNEYQPDLNLISLSSG